MTSTSNAPCGQWWMNVIGEVHDVSTWIMIVSSLRTQRYNKQCSVYGQRGCHLQQRVNRVTMIVCGCSQNGSQLDTDISGWYQGTHFREWNTKCSHIIELSRHFWHTKIFRRKFHFLVSLDMDQKIPSVNACEHITFTEKKNTIKILLPFSKELHNVKFENVSKNCLKLTVKARAILRLDRLPLIVDYIVRYVTVNLLLGVRSTARATRVLVLLAFIMSGTILLKPKVQLLDRTWVLSYYELKRVKVISSQ